MLVDDEIGDHTEEAYSRAGLITAMSVSFCLPHPVAVSAFMICRGLCAYIEMLRMCVLYVSFGSKVRPRTFGCVAMGSALLFILSCCCLPTPMALASGGSPMFPLVVHQPAVQSLRRGLSTNPGATMWVQLKR